MTRKELEDKITVLFGGEAFYDTDNITRSMVQKYGMIEQLGLVDLEEDRGGNCLDRGYPSLSRSVSEETAREIDVAVRELIKTCYGLLVQF